MRTYTVATFALAAVIALAGLASAVYAETSGPFITSTPVPLTKTDWTGILNFPRFDPTLGVLTQVDISVTAYMETMLTVNNTATSVSSGKASTEVQVTLMDPLDLMSVELDFYSPNYAFTLSPGQSATSGVLAASDTETQSFSSVDILSEFTGPGTIAMNADTFTYSWIVFSGGNANAVQATRASVTGNVTYHYSAVPEVPAYALFVLPTGLGLLSHILRRRR